MKIHHWLVPVALLIAGCGAPSSPDSADSTDSSEEALLAQVAPIDAKLGKSGLPAPDQTAARLYFDDDQTFFLNNTLDDHVFTARAGHRFNVTVSTISDDDGSLITDTSFGFKLYRLAVKSGQVYWHLITTVDGEQGEASFSYKGAVTRWYKVETAADSAKILLHLGCSGASHSKCAVGPQPHDVCAGKCDSGLYCQYAEGTCGTPHVGTCAVSPTSCPKLGLACFPVCGCDGKTYCNGCDVTSHRVSIEHKGQCGCDATAFTPGNITTGDSTWTYVDPASNDHYTYTFAGKGGVTSEHDPGCLFATPIHCNIAVAPKHGSYTFVSPTEIVITYDDGSKATLDGLVNCQGDNRLTGTDWGRSLTLAPQ